MKLTKMFWFLARVILKGMFILLLASLLALLIRVFLFSNFLIPSPSMEPALLCGDRIIVNKQIPGPRIYKSLDFVEYDERPSMFRIKGLRAVRRNDVLVFNYPFGKGNSMGFSPDVYYVKRCLATPGDTFSIVNGINKVHGCDENLGNVDQQLKLAEIPEDELNQDSFYSFPYHESLNWNIKNFGPLYVPQKGDTLFLDAKHFYLYAKLIEYETGKTLYRNNGQVYAGDSILTHYVFTLNYYFMAGDMVFDSQDSRYWGLLPEEHIVGKVSLVWNSVDPHSKKTRWDRVLRSL